MVGFSFRRFWGGSLAAERHVHSLWTDILLLGGISGLAYGAFRFGGQWTAAPHHAVAIDLSPWRLPWYTFQSLSRGLIAYVASLVFTLLYGFWAAKDRRAERVLVPLLDILQSIPVLGFMPGLVIALVAIFPNSNVGLELAAVLMIFTGQVWNMTFSLYRSLQSVPLEQQEAARIFGMTWWQRLTKVELPFATTGLVWNSMMSMAGGWFFLMINESFHMGDEDYRLSGLGAYMSVAQDHKDYIAQAWGIVAMIIMIVTLDQLLWRPLVVWAQKFRVEDSAAQDVTSSWFLDLIRRSHVPTWIGRITARKTARSQLTVPTQTVPAQAVGSRPSSTSGVWSILPLVILLAGLAWGAWLLIGLIWKVPGAEWLHITEGAGATLLRVVLSTAIGTLWAVPAGLAIGLSPRLSRYMQPVIQVAASFPAPMLFPMAVAVLGFLGVPLGIGSIVLMLLGTQWYILFNVIAGASALPADLREAATTYRISGWLRFRSIYLPAIFPFLVTGWVTAMGGAWNASIVSEYLTIQDVVHRTFGLGAMISEAADKKDLAQLAASVVVMAVVVVGINRLLWRRLYHIAEIRYALNK